MSNKHIELIKDIVNRYINPKENKAFIFGSRAAGSFSKYSDYDIGIEGVPIKPRIYFELESAIEESPLPFTVDIVEFRNVSDSFKRIAKRNIILLN